MSWAWSRTVKPFTSWLNDPVVTGLLAVIPAAGVGARMAADRPKQYLQLGGRTILEHSLGCFLDHPA